MRSWSTPLLVTLVIVVGLVTASAPPVASQQFEAERVFWGFGSAPCVNCEFQIETVAWPTGTIGAPGTFAIVPRTSCAEHLIVRTTNRVVDGTWRVGAHMGLYNPCPPPSSWRILFSAADA